ncbi:MAG: metal-dependent hydrolase [Deltaproteobacteria bacterium]|nr:metal-dependent hydrolase [Deltaproteobacteria bacterium]
MPTTLGHAMVGLGCGAFAYNKELPKRANLSMLATLGGLSVLPDLDVIAFGLGIPYRHLFGHRGFFHSLLFVGLCALVSWVIFRMSIKLYSEKTPAWHSLMIFLVVAISHPLLDMMTNGGLGIALFAPFSEERFFLPMRPIPVSPIGISWRLYSIFAWEAAVLGPVVAVTWIGRLLVSFFMVKENADVA